MVAAESAVLVGLSAGLLAPVNGVFAAVAFVAFLGGALLLGAFTVGMAISLRRGDRAPCHCFGTRAAPLGAGQVIRNLVLSLVAVVGAATALGGPGDVGVAGVAVAAFAGLSAGLLATRLDDLLDLFTSAGDLAGHR